MYTPDGFSCLSTVETISIDGCNFCVWPDFCSKIDPIEGATSFVPATVVQWNQKYFGIKDYNEICARFAKFDDVWKPVFLHAFILRAPITTIIKDTIPSKHFIVIDPASLRLPDGPFIINPATGKICSIARLFQDTYSSFIGGGVVFDSSLLKYRWLGTDHISVPSRLYYSKTCSTPLAGVRFAVKDTIHVAGLETGCGSVRHRKFYPPASSSAPFIDKLVDAGAVLMGKNICTQFGDAQNPAERFEEVTPFNPRGDGYQLPSGSSSGSAASCAGYDWLDFTVGTDTGGSIRHPAGVNGIYGMRPSLNTVASSGMVVTPLLDTVGVFARSASVLETASKCIAEPSFDLIQPSTPPSRFKLLYPVCARPEETDASPPKWFPASGESDGRLPAESIFEKVVQQLEQHLGCERQPFNLEDLWNTTSTRIDAESLVGATGTMYQNIVHSSQVQSTLATFIADYKAAHNGREPMLEPLVRERLDYGRALTPASYQKAVDALEKFSHWVRHVLFAAAATTSSSETTIPTVPILIYPQTWGVPQYRDTQREPDSPLFSEGFSTYSISYASGCPDITVPVGEVEFHSKFSPQWNASSHNHDQQLHLPVALSFLSPPGTDLVLLRLLRDLEKCGILKSVCTGARLYATTAPASPTARLRLFNDHPILESDRQPADSHSPGGKAVSGGIVYLHESAVK